LLLTATFFSNTHWLSSLFFSFPFSLSMSFLIAAAEEETQAHLQFLRAEKTKKHNGSPQRTPSGPALKTEDQRRNGDKEKRCANGTAAFLRTLKQENRPTYSAHI
jgi:hypothetical protein